MIDSVSQGSRIAGALPRIDRIRCAIGCFEKSMIGSASFSHLLRLLEAKDPKNQDARQIEYNVFADASRLDEIMRVPRMHEPKRQHTNGLVCTTPSRS